MDQIIAIAWLRYRLVANGFRRERGIPTLISAIVLALFGTGLSVGLAVALGALAYTGADSSGHDLTRLALLLAFWGTFVLGLVMPMVLSAGAQGFDTSSLVTYPLSRVRLFVISIGSAFLSPDHLLYYPALLAVFLGGLVLRGNHALAGSVFFLLVPCIVVVWAYGITSALQGILRKRRSRELLGIVGFGILVIGGLMPAFLSKTIEEQEAGEWGSVIAYLAPFEKVAYVLPPHLATDGIEALGIGGWSAALPQLVMLLVWFAAGSTMAYWAFTHVALSPRVGSGRRRTGEKLVERRGPDMATLLPFFPIEALAVASKELRYLLRSSIGRFNLVMIPLFAALVGLVVAPKLEGPMLGIEPLEVGLYGLVLYLVLFTNNFVNNSLGWEGAGFKTYLMCPVPLERVILGKNLGVWIYNVILLAVCMVAWIVLTGFPTPLTLLSALLIFVVSCIGFAGAGNFVSFAFPVARDISSMKNKPSQAAILLSMLTILGLGVANFLFLTLPILLGVPGGPLPFLVVLLVITVAAYRLALPPAARYLAKRKDAILSILEGPVAG